MSKFKKGDRVRVINKDGEFKVGDVFTVDRTAGNVGGGNHFDKDGNCILGRDLELALPKNLKDANIKLKVTPEQSRRVQEICFENEVTWTTGDEVHNLEWPALHIEGKALTGYGTLTYAFIEDKVTEITYDQFMEQWGEKVKDQRVAFSTSTFTGIRMCIDCGQDHLTDTNILQKPKKGGLMSSLKKVTNFIKSLKQPLKNYVRLSWVEVEGDDFIVTSKGTEALEAVQFGLTDAKTLTEYAQMEVKRIKEEEAK